jgi:hypothetical protein
MEGDVDFTDEKGSLDAERRECGTRVFERGVVSECSTLDMASRDRVVEGRDSEEWGESGGGGIVSTGPAPGVGQLGR